MRSRAGSRSPIPMEPIPNPMNSTATIAPAHATIRKTLIRGSLSARSAVHM